MTLRDLLSQPSSFSSHSNPSPQSISDSISIIQSAISHWDPHTSISTSFLQASNNLHSHLLRLSTSSSATAASINHADQLRNIHTLLQSAMECLGESLRYHLFSISAIDLCSDKIATARSISQTMLSAGYGNECVSAYQSIHQSRITSQMVQLGFDQSANQPKAIRKLKWEILDRQIKSWTGIAPIVVQSLCSDEKQLCDEIFAMSPESVQNSIFSSIACDTALRFLSFPETVAVHLEHSPEKLFRLLDMYAVLSNLLPDIELIFGFKPDSSVRSQATISLAKLSEAIRVVISNFELAIQKDPIKSSGVLGSAIHPLTRYVMNYLVYLSDFDLYLHQILVKLPPNCSSSFFEISDKLKNNGSVVSVTIAWMLFILLCKIDSKAETYSDAALSYLFLANNLGYIVRKVQNCHLKEILSDDWMNEHGTKARQFMEGHVRSGWAHMAAMLRTKNETTEVVERLREFEMAFEKAMEERKNWAIADVAMRDEVRLMVEAMLVPEYCRWYRTHKDFGTVRFSPEDVKTSIMRFYAE
ncbi:exocyst complex component EXO70A1-like protein [Carex littledalei]|uniref:Exocyst subunit Exo70 family protein n=1 Tax=Carex littledalei TaxID=544730 RepID=A0A833VQU9_9POAL|nr:exocyst complex component EXO70A1-like protein [Carex littledalei]